jgi:hypothetical protein
VAAAAHHACAASLHADLNILQFNDNVDSMHGSETCCSSWFCTNCNLMAAHTTMPLQVSTRGLQEAHAYILRHCQQLQVAAEGSGLVVESSVEHYTGSFDFDFVGERFVNAYHNISNIILHISRKGSEQQPAVLLVAHHDSPVGSPGQHRLSCCAAPSAQVLMFRQNPVPSTRLSMADKLAGVL